MDRRIAELNIEHLQEKLATETDQGVRETIKRLLKEERAKLEELARRAVVIKKSG